MTKVGWMRVSTRDQSLELQRELLEKEGCTKLFGGVQSGTSKRNDDELAKLLDWIREEDVVVVQKIDRLGRSLKSVLQTIDTIHEKGAFVRALDQNIDTSKQNDPMSKMMISLLGMFAQLERDMIRERSVAGKQRTGNYGGRPSRLNDEQKALAKRLYKEGRTVNSIATQLGVHGMTISRLVK